MELKPLKYFESLYPEDTREKEIRQYLEFLKKGLSAQIIGLPGVGKNNLLRLLAYNVKAREYHLKKYESITHFVYIDAGEAKGRGQMDLIKLILSSIAFSLGERNMTKEALRIKSLLEEAIQMNDEFLMFQYLKKAIDFLTIEKKLSVILLFDRFDTIAPTLTEDFFSNLKSLRNHAKYRFGVVFSLKRPLEETVDVNLIADFSDIISENEIYIELSDPVALKFRTGYIEKAARKPLPSALKDEITKLTGGHSKLTKLSFEKIVSDEKTPENLERYLLDLASITKALDEIWDSLLPSEKIELKTKTFSQNSYLEKTGLIKNNKISIPLLSAYIENKKIENNEKIIYDNEKNEVLKGDASISNTLSSSEFKLLKFMIENKGKILSKDELIEKVWSDQKTQEGVTDQAFDQIIYRLRKKIETDPSNPQFIQTIKGTGYKFSDN